MNTPWTAASVRMLFESSGDSRGRSLAGEHQEFAAMLNAHQVLYDRRPTVRPPEPMRDELAAYQCAFSGNTSQEHGQLKWAGWCWLRAMGEPLPHYETRVVHGVADVVGPTLRCIVECGDTAPRKVLQALRSGWLCFALFPFPYVDIPVWRAAGRPREQEPFIVREVICFARNPVIPLPDEDLFYNNAAGQVGL